jgi:hypothetical protein
MRIVKQRIMNNRFKGLKLLLIMTERFREVIEEMTMRLSTVANALTLGKVRRDQSEELLL